MGGSVTTTKLIIDAVNWFMLAKVETHFHNASIGLSYMVKTLHLDLLSMLQQIFFFFFGEIKTIDI